MTELATAAGLPATRCARDLIIALGTAAAKARASLRELDGFGLNPGAGQLDVACGEFFGWLAATGLLTASEADACFVDPSAVRAPLATAAELTDEADRLDVEADALRARAQGVQKSELKAQPLGERLIYAARSRCDCGAGLAYDPASDGEGVFKGPSQWECSAILRKDELAPEELAAAKAAIHSPPFPFAFYEIKSERQPSQGGATTRPGGVAKGVYGAAN